MKRLPRPGLASLEWSSLAADTGTFGAGKPEGHSAQDGCFCAGSPTTSILTNGRARQSLVYRFVRRRAGAPTVASSRTASSTKPRNRRRPGLATGFSRSLRKTADRDVPDAKRRTLPDDRKRESAGHGSPFGGSMPVEMNPDLLQWAGDEAEPGDAHDFLRRFPVGTDRRQPVAALFSAKSAFRNRRKRADWPPGRRAWIVSDSAGPRNAPGKPKLEDKDRNRPDRPCVSGPAPAGVSPLTNRSTARSALPKRVAHRARLTGRRLRCAARPGPAPSRQSRRPARLRRPRTARRR